MTRNKGVADGVAMTSDEETLTDCQELCVSEHPGCLAVDYKDGMCSLIGEYGYRHDKLIENVGNVHSVLKPCYPN